MRAFARLYGPDADQILVVRGQSEDNRPQLVISWQPKSDLLAVCSQAITFADSDFGDMQCRLAFSTMTEEKARAAIKQSRELADSLAPSDLGGNDE